MGERGIALPFVHIRWGLDAFELRAGEPEMTQDIVQNQSGRAAGGPACAMPMRQDRRDEPGEPHCGQGAVQQEIRGAAPEAGRDRTPSRPRASYTVGRARAKLPVMAPGRAPCCGTCYMPHRSSVSPALLL